MRALVGVTSLVLAVAADAWATPLAYRDILVSIFDQGILAVNPDTGLSTLVAAGTYQDFSIAPTGEIYALTGQYGDPDAAVVQIDPGTGSVETVSSGGLFMRPAGISVNPNGIFILDRPFLEDPIFEARIIAIDEVTRTQSLFVEDLGIRLVGSGGPKSDLESDSNGNLYAAVSRTGVETLARVDGRTGEVQVFPDGIEASGIGLGVGEDVEETIFIATDGGLDDSLWGLDPLTGDVFPVRSGLISIDVDVEDSGSLIIATGFGFDSLNLCPDSDVRRCLVRYDPETHEVLRVFDDIRFVHEVQIVPSTIPEPSTAALVVLGLALVSGARRQALQPRRLTTKG